MDGELEPQAAGIPEQILGHKRAIDLYLIAVGALALMGLLAIIGAIVLALFDRTVPGEVWTIVGLAVGALSVMLGGRNG